MKMTQQNAPRKKRKKVISRPKQAQPKDDEPRYKCMVCEYVPCICSSVGTWNRGY